MSIINSSLAETDLNPKYLKLGFEEKFFLQDPEKALLFINELSKTGIQFTIDGLGRGKSMFNLLHDLPKNTIVKIDKAYVENIIDCPSDQSFLLKLLDLIKSRNLDAIISGIENREQVELLNTKNCFLQGFYFNKSKSFQELSDDLQTIKKLNPG